jgi:hypothetical protein
MSTQKTSSAAYTSKRWENARKKGGGRTEKEAAHTLNLNLYSTLVYKDYLINDNAFCFSQNPNTWLIKLAKLKRRVISLSLLEISNYKTFP